MGLDKHKLRLVFLLELIMLVAGVLYLYRNIDDVKIPACDLQSENAILMDNPPGEIGDTSGYYIDNSLTKDSASDTDSDQYNWIRTGKVDLQPGTYEVTIDYSANSNDNTYSAANLNNNWQTSIGANNIGISEGNNNEATYRYTTMRKSIGYNITLNYSGNGYLFVSGITIHHTNYLVRMFIFVYILICLFVDILMVLWCKWTKKQQLLFMTGAICVFIASIPLFSPFYPDNGSDIYFHINRIEGLKQAIQGGNIPSRVSLYWNNGYGYAAPLYYCELFLTIPALMRVIGFTMQSSLKAYILLVNAATFMIAWESFKGLFGKRKAAYIATLLYFFAPYRLVCIYTRGALGEYTAQIFLPVVIYGFYRIYQEDDRTDCNDIKIVMPLILGITGIIECHVLSIVMVLIFSLISCLIMVKKTFKLKIIKRLVIMMVGVLALNAWFVVPFLNVIFGWKNMSFYSISNKGGMPAHGARIYELFLPLENYYGDVHPTLVESSGTQLPYTIGIGLTICIYLYLVISIWVRKGERQQSENDWKKVKILFFLGILSLWMSSIAFPWDFIQETSSIGFFLTNNIQYPWRFLGIGSALLASLGGMVYKLIDENAILNRWSNSVAIILICGSISTSGFFLVSYCENTGWQMITNNSQISSTAVGAGEYLPAGAVNCNFDSNECVVKGDSSKTIITEFVRKNGGVSLKCNNIDTQKTDIDIPLLYYEGYKAKITNVAGDNKHSYKVGDEIAVHEDNGILCIETPSEFAGSIKITFVEPVQWRISEFITLISMSLIIVLYNKKSLLILMTKYN